MAENATQIHLSLCSKLFHDLEGEEEVGRMVPRRESGEFFRGMMVLFGERNTHLVTNPRGDVFLLIELSV